MVPLLKFFVEYLWIEFLLLFLVSGNSSAYCTWPTEPNFINPLNLTERSKSDNVTTNVPLVFKAGDKDTSNGKVGSSTSNAISNRVTRDVEKVITSETYIDKNGNKRQVVNMVSTVRENAVKIGVDSAAYPVTDFAVE